jgi:hypothetical protein
LCVIALDRFGDFGGSSNSTCPMNNTDSHDDVTGEHKSNNHTSGMSHPDFGFDDHMLPSYSTWSSSSVGSSVVAPVREVCGQAIAILHAMAPSVVAEQTRAVLFQLCECKLAWEVRHGALIALKYIVVVESTNMLHLRDATQSDTADRKTTSLRKNLKESAVWIEMICRVALNHLSDPSDDVKSASAHLLIELCRHSSDVTNDTQNKKMLFVWDVVSPLWSAIQKERRFSSCIVDLVELCTILVARNCQYFLNALRATSPNDNDPTSDCKSLSIYNLLQFLVTLMDSEFMSVRTSALQSIGVVCNELGTATELNVADDKEYVVAFDTLHDLPVHILKLFVNEASNAPTDTTSTDYKNKFSNDILFRAWTRICIAVNRIVKRRDLPKLDTSLLSWYFQIREERELVLGDVPIRLDASHALAYYLMESSHSGAISDIAQTMIFAYVSSPWPTQVESACLLHVELDKCLTDQASLIEVGCMISLETPMLCLTPNVWKMALKDASLPAVCDQICLDIVAEVKVGSKTPHVGAEHIRLSWLTVFAEIQRTQAMFSNQIVCPVTEMRLLAIVAGSIIVKGVPTKLTPVVRALMTFFHNERLSAARAALVESAIVQLLQLVMDKPKYANARTKIVATLCDAITYRTLEKNMNDFCVAMASSILQSMVQRLRSLQTIIDIAPIWHRLQPVIEFDFSNTSSDIALLDAMDLLEVLLTALPMKHVLTNDLIKRTVPALIELLLLSGDTSPSRRAVSTIVATCHVSPGCLLEVAIPAITRELDDQNNNYRRLAACRLLEKLMSSSATEMCPFVRILLPRVLSLMSDNMVECSQCAVGIFASLIKVAPLAQQSSLNEQDNNRNGSVIDHLIFGKKLPPCTFPIELISAMGEKGVSLRTYQQEGVAWLHFLQSVNLNGALCDGKSSRCLTNCDT